MSTAKNAKCQHAKNAIKATNPKHNQNTNKRNNGLVKQQFSQQ